MQRLVCLAFLMVTLVDFLSKGDKWGRLKILPGATPYLFEIVSALVLVLVIVLGTRNRFRYVRPAYWLVFSGFVVVMVCGALVNAVDAGPIFAGVRVYFRSIPWFFLAAVWAFTTEQVRNQLKLLMAICLLQLPSAIEQRIKTGESRMGFTAVTGDWTTGTLIHGGVLSVFLVAAVCVIVAFYERGRLRAVHFIALFLAFLLPTMINETKALVVFIPLGLLGAFLCAARPEVRGRRITVGIGILVLFAAIWLPIYNYMMEGREYGVTLEEFFSGEKSENLDSYMSGGDSLGSIGEEVRRGTAMRVSIQEISKDPVSLVFGFGIGNVSNSSLGPGFTGKYDAVYGKVVIMTFTRLVLELGIAGIVLMYWLHWLILEDCRALARTRSGLLSDLAAGWAGVVLLMAVATVYVPVEAFSSLAMPFWFFSGLIAAERMRRAVASQAPRA